MDLFDLTPELRYRAAVQGGLLSGEQLRCPQVGRSRMATMVKHGLLKRITRNVYSVRGVGSHNSGYLNGDDIQWRRIRSAWTGLLSTPTAIATGSAALALHGVWGLPNRIAPEITLRTRARSDGAAGVRTRQFAAPFDLTTVHGRQIAAPVPSLVQALPELAVDHAIAVVDSALNKGIIDAVGVGQVRSGLRGRRGVRALGRWWEQVDGRAESPMETRARLDCRRAGLPEPAVQPEIRGPSGGLIARADLGWMRPSGRWVLVEIDGREAHDTPDAVFTDRQRQNRIHLHGQHTILRFTGRDVLTGRVAPVVAQALLNDPM